MVKKNEVFSKELMEEIEKLGLGGSDSKSDLMRKLYENGKSVSDISKLLNSHYSFVYGVIDRYSDGNIRKEVKESKSDVIRNMWDKNMSVGEISKELNSNYSYVFSVVKKYRESK